MKRQVWPGHISGQVIPWGISPIEPVVEAAPEPQRSERLRRVCDVLLLESDEPTTYAEAMVIPDSEAWLEAMRSELNSMDKNQVWDLVDPLLG